MYKYNFDTIIETKNLKTALNKAGKQMEKLNLDSSWLDLEIIKEIKDAIRESMKNENKNIINFSHSDLREYAGIIDENGFAWPPQLIEQAIKELKQGR